MKNEADIVDNWAEHLFKDNSFDSIKYKLRCFYKELSEYESSRVELPVKPEIADIVKNILHEGVNIAMYGNPFESEERVIKEQEKLYDEAIKNYTVLIQKQFSV